MDSLELLDIVNIGLSEGKAVTQIGREIGLSESAIRKRLQRLGYKREGNKFVLNTSSNTPLKKKVIKNNKPKAIDPKPVETNQALNIDMDKLSLLLENLDKILKMIPKEDNNNFEKSNIRQVTSFRIDTGVHRAVKDYAQTRNISISDIVEKSLLDYLNNYL